VDLLTVGEAFEDLVFAGLPHLPHLGEELRVKTLTRHAGGGAVITAIAAARLGFSVSTISGVSRENAGRLRRERVGVVNVRKPTERGAVSIALSTRRDRAFVTYEGVNRVLEPRLIATMRRITRVPQHVHFALGPRRSIAWVPIVERLRVQGATTSWDFGWNEALLRDRALERLFGALDWIFVNEREAMLYARRPRLASAVSRWQTLARGTVVKLGARGAMAVVAQQQIHKRAPRVVVTDTTGAGDAFNAGFIAGLLAGVPLDEALRLGNHVGARSTRSSGGVDGLPSRNQLPSWARRIIETK
jgi:sugar/nucleoside kinase (ribokinase family)